MAAQHIIAIDTLPGLPTFIRIVPLACGQGLFLWQGLPQVALKSPFISGTMCRWQPKTTLHIAASLSGLN
jgi:hypothetical protein